MRNAQQWFFPKKPQKGTWRVPLGVFLVSLALLVFFVAMNRSATAWTIFTQFHLPRVAAALEPNDATLQFAIGNYYFGGSKEYDVERAEEFFRRTVAINFFYPVAHYQLGRTLFIKGDMYLAEREIDEELKLHPEFWRSYYMRALIRGYSGNLLGAAGDFAEFLRHRPESWAAHNDLAWVYFRLGDYAKVKEVAADGLRYAPDNPWLNNSLGIALMNLGDNEGARTALLNAAKGSLAMTPEIWGGAYPGNDPSVYSEGLEAMRSSIKRNLALLVGTSTTH